jgi:uncharacterized protein (DUF362 family)
MQLEATEVGILQNNKYALLPVKEAVDQLCMATGLQVNPGSKVLLKPNLVSGRGKEHLACTHPVFIRAVAEWFADHQVSLSIGDSPAFGSARGVMQATGISDALKGLPIKLVDFDQSQQVKLAGGVSVDIARHALECDMLINLPKVKAHSQLYVTLGVKNYFGTVVGFQKPVWHMRYGNHEDRFAAHIVDLLAALPGGMTLIDGITAMHETGPVGGLPYPLGLLAGSLNPVAIDTTFLEILKLDYEKSFIWRECAARRLTGANHEKLRFPFLNPADVQVADFQAPEMLLAVSFNPFRMLVSAVRRLLAKI